MTSSQKWSVRVGDYVMYLDGKRDAVGTVTEVSYHGSTELVRVQLAKSMFGYNPPESIVTSPSHLRLISRDQGAQA